MDLVEFKETINEFVDENLTASGNEHDGFELIPQDGNTYQEEMGKLYNEVCGCKACNNLMELFNNFKNATNRDYWLMTELFVLLHNGKDYCDGSNKSAVYLKSDETSYNPFPKINE